MKTVNKRILLGFQIAVAPFFLAALLEGILQLFGYHIFLFGQVGRPILLISASVFVTLEGIMLLVLAIVTDKLRYFLLNLLLGPLVLLLILFGWLALRHDTRVHRIDEFDEELVVTNWSVLMLGESYVYQKEIPFIVKEVAWVGGDDGWCPLSDEHQYKWTVSGDELTLTYDFYGYGENTEQMRFRYENGRFVKIYDSLM